MSQAPTTSPTTSSATDIGDGNGIERLLRLMQQLRDPVGGCEWDLAQNFETIAPFTIEEAYEVADAIASGNPDNIRDELGDLLLQVVFHAQIARDDGLFDFDAVAHGITDKMIRRHPHIFTDAPRRQQKGEWEAIKADERSKEQASGALSGVALALPALKRAEKLQARAARVGFDWPDISGPLDKLNEEIGELTEAATEEHRFEEMGDLLFAAANVARKYGIDPEAALAAANRKFEARFAGMEARAGGSIDGLSLDDQEALWQAVKAAQT
jgi:ATP diphosphatase